MREIYRGKPKKEYARKKYGEWVYGWYCPTPFGSWPLTPAIYPAELAESGEWRAIEIITETLGRCVDLTDKNDKEIFEGDVFKFQDDIWDVIYTSCGPEYNSHHAENYAVVGFHEDTQAPDFVRYAFNDSQVEADLHENYEIDFYDFVSNLEIIGNIHDNPKLMEEEE